MRGRPIYNTKNLILQKLKIKGTSFIRNLNLSNKTSIKSNHCAQLLPSRVVKLSYFTIQAGGKVNDFQSSPIKYPSFQVNKLHLTRDSN